MPPRMDGSRLVAVVLAAALVRAIVSWLALRAGGADTADASGRWRCRPCAELAATELGELDEDPAWHGCLTCPTSGGWTI